MWRSNSSVVCCCVLGLLESARALVFVVEVLGHGFRAEPEIWPPSLNAERIERNYWRLTMADQPAKKQKTDVETLGISEMKALIKSAGLSSADCVEKSDLRARCREDGPMDLAEYICEAGDGMTVNLLDRPAEQIGSLLDGAPNHAATVNTIRRGLREFGLSA